MTPANLLLVIAAAFLHAGWNLLAKRAAPAGVAFVFAYNLVSCLAYAPWVIWLLATGGFAWTHAAIGFVLLSGVIHLAYSLCLQRGYQVADLSVVYPVARGTGPMLATLGAVIVLGELPSLAGLAGLLLVVSGIALIATDGNFTAMRRPGGLAGVRWGGATGALIAAYTVADGYSVKALGITPVLLDWCANIFRFVLLAPPVLANPRRSLAAMQGHWWRAIGVGLFSPLAYILVLTALTRGAPLAVVAPMREMSMMVGALLGMAVLRERVGRWRFAGCALLVAGVVLLYSA